MDMMSIRRAVIIGSHETSTGPSIYTVQSGNTTDSTAIAHFATDMASALEEIKIALPYKSGGYSGVTLTACGVNLLKCSFTDGTAHGLTYAKTVNASGEVTAIAVSGRTSQANAFRNINYTANTYKLPKGTMAFNAFSNQVNLIATGLSGNYRTTDGYVPSTFPSAGCHIYNITNDNGGADWARSQIFPYEANTDVDTTFYPMICLATDYLSSFEPYDAASHTVSFSTTVYGGTVDFLAGTGTNEYASDGTAITPTTFTFATPSGITAKVGVNNVWASDGTVTVKYWKS